MPYRRFASLAVLCVFALGTSPLRNKSSTRRAFFGLRCKAPCPSSGSSIVSTTVAPCSFSQSAVFPHSSHASAVRIWIVRAGCCDPSRALQRTLTIVAV